jgi:hypothetical protein
MWDSQTHPGASTRPEEFLCLLIRSGSDDDIGPMIQRLLLEPAGDVAGEFRRFGRFTLNLEEKTDLFNRSCRYFDTHAEESEFVYERDEKGFYKYDITII